VANKEQHYRDNRRLLDTAPSYWLCSWLENFWLSINTYYPGMDQAKTRLCPIFVQPAPVGRASDRLGQPGTISQGTIGPSKTQEG
jgi:hypothetical protein